MGTLIVIMSYIPDHGPSNYFKATPETQCNYNSNPQYTVVYVCIHVSLLGI